MTGRTHFYEPGRGHGLKHDPFNAIVAPRPIGWISTRNSGGVRNLAPYSFFNALNYVPPIIAFSSIGRKDTLDNVRETGEFVWNLVTRGLTEAMNTTSAAVPNDVDEFELAGLTPAPARLVGASLVAESPVAFECRLSQIVQLTDAAGASIQTWLVLGEVVGVHISTTLLSEGVYDTAASESVLRGGGLGTYFTVSAAQRFEIARPTRQDKGAPAGDHISRSDRVKPT